MSKSYRTTKQVESRIAKIKSLKHPTDDNFKELAILEEWLPEIDKQEKDGKKRKADAHEFKIKSRENKKKKFIKRDKLEIYESLLHHKYEYLKNVLPPASKSSILKYLRWCYPVEFMMYTYHNPSTDGTSKSYGKLVGRYSDLSLEGLMKILLNAELHHPDIDFYRIIFKTQISGSIFVRKYSLSTYKELFPEIPDEVLAQLYFFTPTGSTVMGAGEFLKSLKIYDINKDKSADICTNSDTRLECKAGSSLKGGGRMVGQAVKPDVNLAANACKVAFTPNDTNCFIFYDAMPKLWSNLRKTYNDVEIMEKMCFYRLLSYDLNLTDKQKELFTKEMVELVNDILEGGEFTMKSVDKFNGYFDTYCYCINENFTHLTIDSPVSREHDELYGKPFDAKFVILSKSEIDTPEKINKLVKEGHLGFTGPVKNNGRDSASHVYWIF